MRRFVFAILGLLLLGASATHCEGGILKADDAAARSGQNPQIVLQPSIAVGVVAAIFVVLAASMFGMFDIQLPNAWVNRISNLSWRRAGSAGSAAVLGFTSATVVGPCVTAPLAAALLYIAQTGDAALGATLLFTLGLDQGIPLIVFGSFGSRVLPRAGQWTVYVKQAFGLVFVALAIWMATRMMPDTVLLALTAVSLIASGVVVGRFHRTETAERNMPLKTIGVGLLFFGIAVGMAAVGSPFDTSRPPSFLLTSASDATDEHVNFGNVTSPRELSEELSDVFAEGRPSIVYLTADWCISCKTVERDVLATAEVEQSARGFNLLKLDVTRLDDFKEALMRDLDVVGPPTRIFFNSASNEAPGSRLVGEISKSSFLASTQMVRR